jgi:drug/metabolite transporter (DMT)-like permease
MSENAHPADWGPAFGQVCSLGTALLWAMSLVFFKRSGESVPPLALNLYKNLVSMVLLTATLVLLEILQRCGVTATGAGLHELRAQSGASIAILMISGVLGIAVADTLIFACLNASGLGVLAVVECLYSPMVLAFSWLLLGAALSWRSALGGVLVLTAVLFSTRLGYSANDHRRMAAGIASGAAAMVCIALGIVIATTVLESFPILWATTLRLVAGTLGLLGYGLIMPRHRAQLSGLRPSRVWRTMLPGAVLGGYGSYILWIAGFKYCAAPVAAILNQTSTIFALILATLVLREPFSDRKAVAVGLAIVGVTLVLLERK